jgi:hypothetical protein
LIFAARGVDLSHRVHAGAVEPGLRANIDQTSVVPEERRLFFRNLSATGSSAAPQSLINTATREGDTHESRRS